MIKQEGLVRETQTAALLSSGAAVERLRRNAAHVPDPVYFTLGRWGLPVNVVAVMFGVFMLVNIGWPRAEIYDLDGRGWFFSGRR